MPSTETLPPALLDDGPRFDFAFTVQLTLSTPQIVKCRQLGHERAGVFATQGSFEGPRIRGEVLGSSGGDYAAMRPDGVLDFDARYMLRADDGTLIYLQSRGYRWLAPADAAPGAAPGTAPGTAPEAAYMRVCTRFEVEAGPHDWLARHVFVGLGRRTATGNLIRYYCLM